MIASRLMVACLLAMLLAPVLPVRAEHTSYLKAAEAVNKAGRQRMLSQRMAKSYLQVALGIQGDAARGQLAEALAVFDDQMVDLEDFQTESDLRAPFLELKTQWQAFRALVVLPPSRERALSLLAACDALLDAAERNTAALEHHAGSAGARLVNISGRQRMLSQRIARDYLYLAWRFDDASIRKDLESSREEFRRAHAELDSAAQNTDEIRKELSAVAVQWKEFEVLLGRERANAAERARLIAIADAILGRMERVTALYQKL